MIKSTLKKILNRMGYDIRRKGRSGDAFLPYLNTHEQEFLSIFERCSEYTMVSQERSFGLYKAIEYVIKNDIQGDFVECGAWKGGQAMLMAYTLMKEGVTDRKIWLYDTYEGMTEPCKEDWNILKGKPAIKTWKHKEKDDHNEWCYAGLEEVRSNMNSTGYPEHNLLFVKGKVEETIRENMPTQIAILRLDTDWYASTLCELEFLFPLLADGGVLILDDYGTWEGARRATDEYLKKENAQILLSPLEHGRIGVKIKKQ